EHLPDLSPLYGEAWRLAKADGLLVLVGFHPHIIMASGMPTHFQNAAGEQVAIETHVHLLSEHAYGRAEHRLEARRDERAARRRRLARGQAVVGALPWSPTLLRIRLAEALRLSSPEAEAHIPANSLHLNPNFSHASCLLSTRRIT